MSDDKKILDVNKLKEEQLDEKQLDEVSGGVCVTGWYEADLPKID